MRPLRLVYLPAAARDLAAAYRYIERDAPASAGGWLDSIDRALSRLSRFPESGHPPRDPKLSLRGYRVLVIGDYLAFYVVRSDRVEIRRIVHGRRRYSFV